MKMITIVGSIHFEPDIKKVLKEAGIKIYSQTKINGYNDDDDENLRSNWFAMSEGYQKSILFFSFDIKDKTDKALKLISEFNENIKSKSRIRAFVVPVEQYI